MDTALGLGMIQLGIAGVTPLKLGKRYFELSECSLRIMAEHMNCKAYTFNPLGNISDGQSHLVLGGRVYHMLDLFVIVAQIWTS